MESNEIELLEYLSQWEFTFGILDSDSQRLIEITILNTDNTQTTQIMKLGDIMYFTEYGTVTIPGKYILEKSLTLLNPVMDKKIGEIVEDILEERADRKTIEKDLKKLAFRLETILRNYIVGLVDKTNKIGSILYQDKDDNRYLYSLEKLSKYIKCEARFKN